MKRNTAPWPNGRASDEFDDEALISEMHLDERFLAAVKKAIEQADRGEFIEEEEMDARVERMLHRLEAGS